MVLKAGTVADAGDLADWCHARLAGFKRPRGITFLAPDEMPRNATGKILHRVLKDMLEDRA